MNIQKDIEAATHRFIKEMTGLIREAARERILHVLTVDWGTNPQPQLPMPRRQPKRIGRAKTHKPKGLPPSLSQVYDHIKKAQHPVTSKTIATTIGRTESHARQILGKLLNKQLVTTKQLGDGTARKVYIPI